MPAFHPVALQHASRLVNHGPTVLVTSAHGGRRNVLAMPVLKTGCPGWLECRLIPEPHTEDAYDSCFGEVVAAAADARIFENGHWNFRDDNASLQSIHYLGAGLFVCAGGAVRAAAMKENP